MGSKSKKDRVDLLLISELREEEKAWTQEWFKTILSKFTGHFPTFHAESWTTYQYDEDEDYVMSNLTDSILDFLIDDTITVLREVEMQRLNC